MKVAYVAGPYRAKNGRSVSDNIAAAKAVAIELWKAGYAVICPHLNTAYFDILPGSRDLPDSVWLEGDLEILSRCDVIVMMPGWRDSVGAVGEYELACKLALVVCEWEHPIERYGCIEYAKLPA